MRLAGSYLHTRLSQGQAPEADHSGAGVLHRAGGERDRGPGEAGNTNNAEETPEEAEYKKGAKSEAPPVLARYEGAPKKDALGHGRHLVE